MPRDRLDGIKTKEGRVVYDRKKHEFTVNDLRRILKKRDLLREPADGGKNKIFWNIISEIIEILIQYILEGTESPLALSIALNVALSIDRAINYCDGKNPERSGFGGGGTSRTY